MSLEQIFELVVGAAAVASAITMVLSRNMVMSVLSMILNFICLAILYLTLNAQFIAVLQILVYAGGIMVLFLFVIMLLNIRDTQHSAGKSKFNALLAIAIGVGFLTEMIILIVSSASRKASSLPESAARLGTVESIGKALYTSYLLPFEAVSFLLLAAIIGALILAKKKLD